MLDTVRPYFNRVVEVSDSARTGDEGTDGMMLSEVDALAAAALPGPAVHRDVADALEAVLRDLIA